MKSPEIRLDVDLSLGLGSRQLLIRPRYSTCNGGKTDIKSDGLPTHYL
jgi:hypothetical protein